MFDMMVYLTTLPSPTDVDNKLTNSKAIIAANKQVFPLQQGRNRRDWDDLCHISQIGKMVKLFLHHKQRVGYVLSIGIELSISCQPGVELANLGMANFGEMSKKYLLYMRTYHRTG